jgi:Ca2+-binding RTX toxin-like protein
MGSVINGTAGNDTLTSTGVGDTLVGGTGSDVYFVNDAADVVSETMGDGPDIFVNDSAFRFYPDAAASGTNVVYVGDAGEIYSKDVVSGVVTLVSSDASGTPANKICSLPVVSADGSKVVFTTMADDLVAGDPINTADVFIKDLTTGAITQVNTDAAGVPHSYASGAVSISADGSKVTFISDGVYVKDLTTGSLTLASSNSIGLNANATSYTASISSDGSKVLFASSATNLVAGDNNNTQDIFLKDLLTGAVTLISAAASGTHGNGYSADPIFSPDGSKVAFTSVSNNLGPTITNTNVLNLYVKDLATGTVTLVSHTPDGTQPDQSILGPVFSADGTKLAFYTFAQNLVADDNNQLVDIYVKDLVSGTITRVSSETYPIGNDYYFAFTPDGHLLFGSNVEGVGHRLMSVDLNHISGVDTVNSSVSYSLGANLENLTLTGSANINATGNSLDNVIRGNTGNNSLDGATGSDTLIGGAGNDLYLVNSAADVVQENANAGIDTVRSTLTQYLSANVENLTLTGTGDMDGVGNNLNNLIIGNSGNNILNGNSGNDTLDGGGGNDLLIGGAGNDVYRGGSGAIQEDANGGIDTVESNFTIGPLVANVENLTLTGTANISGTGNSLNNVLTGNAGNNSLDGGAGADTLIGGAGNDIYLVNSATDVVQEGVNAGLDTVRSSITWSLGANIENLTLTGTSAINGVGNSLDNQLIGNSGANILNGNGGNDTLEGGISDTLIGGSGNDVYVKTNQFGEVREDINGGIDTVQSSFTQDLSANVENLTLTGTANINGTGNALNNVLIGNAGNNQLDGGPVGVDTLIGGAGDDRYTVWGGDDVVEEGVNAGTDTVYSLSDWSLGANLENLFLGSTDAKNGVGNSLDNLITTFPANGANMLNGNGGNDTLDGAGGADTLIGGAGNDVFLLNYDSGVATIQEAVNGGTDSVQSIFTQYLTANVENLILTGSSAVNGIGNDLANTITGNSGNNTLNGNTGNDTLIGGAGNDVYIVDSVLDVVTEASNAGIDTILSTVSFTLSSDVENLTLYGAGNINGTGNLLDNHIVGNDGNNIINGGLGNDILTGGAGNDQFIFTTALNAASNVDSIRDFSTGDTLQLSQVIFSHAGSVGTLNASFFKSGAGLTSGQDSDDRIIYNTSTGNLYYDADGSGAGASILFAQLGTTTHPSLTAAVIQVV